MRHKSRQPTHLKTRSSPQQSSCCTGWGGRRRTWVHLGAVEERRGRTQYRVIGDAAVRRESRNVRRRTSPAAREIVGSGRDVANEHAGVGSTLPIAGVAEADGVGVAGGLDAPSWADVDSAAGGN